MQDNMEGPSPIFVAIVALAVWVLAALLFYYLGSYAGWTSILFGLLVAILVAIILYLWVERAEDDGMSSGAAAPGSSASAPAAATSAASTTAAPAAKPKAAAKPKSAAKPKASAKAVSAGGTKTAPAPKPKAAKTAAAPKKATPSGMKKASKAASGKKAATPSKLKSAAKAAGSAKSAPGESQPETLKKARAGGADDLKVIKGVGPGLEKTLNEMGFYHYDQIAAWGKKEVAWVDARLKFKGRIERDDWIKQAKALAKGK